MTTSIHDDSERGQPLGLGFSEQLGQLALHSLKACPFCGRHDTLRISSAAELAAEDDGDDSAFWPHSDCWAVLCDASRPNGPGGCGASGGFKPTELEAAQAWNLRA